MRYREFKVFDNQAIERLYYVPFQCGRVEEEMLKIKRGNFRSLNDNYLGLQVKWVGVL